MMFMLRRAGSGTSAFNRVRQAAALMATGGRGVVEQMANHCSAAGALADRLGLGADVRAGVEQSYARWDGKGVPADLAGDGAVAGGAHLARRRGVRGVPAHRRRRRRRSRSCPPRSGTHFDPEIVAAVRRDPASLFAGIDDDTVDELLDAEPVERPR